jgi:hypothetical protein
MSVTWKSHGLSMVVVSGLVLLLLAPAMTSAAPIRECGDLVDRYAFNITTRKVSCDKARQVVRRWNGSVAQQGGDGQVLGLYCNFRSLGIESGDIRCTGARGRVVRWQTGV